MDKQEIQETINELHRMKKRLSGAQGCSVHHEEANAYSARCLSIAMSALEKQIPKKIDHDYLSCNSCDGDLEVFARMDIVHCPWCGQRLDWSVGE